VLVVDDSATVRTLLARRLSAQGLEVEEAPDAETALAAATAHPPDVVVTDLHMTGLSGVQLCRVLRGDPATAHIPVVLLTAAGDKRSRFWARSAGAVAYVGKDCVDQAVTLLAKLAESHPPGSAAPLTLAPRRGASMHERMSAVLDAALFDSVIAGEVRALASAGDLAKLFEGLVVLLTDVMSYRWFALAPARPYAPIFVHGHTGEREACEEAARGALGIGVGRDVSFLGDDRATPGAGPPAATTSISFAGSNLGTLALAPTARGLSRDDRRILAIVGTEGGGPLQMTALYEDAQRLATTDALTGLLNRRAFIEAVEREQARSDRHSFPLSLLLLDVDHFKRINDGFGHSAGDLVLQAVARVLIAVARRSDIVGRWGGEEFVLALPQTGEAGARGAAERLRRAIASTPIKVTVGPEAQTLEITASIGVASSEAPWSMEALISVADEAMYAAKGRGRNRVESAGRLMSATHGVETPAK
jgi:two-component system cell cycle response regulator